MVQEINAGHTPEQGRGIANANVKELFERAVAGPKNRITLPADIPNAIPGPVSGAPVFADLGLNMPVEAGVMYRFHAAILFNATAVGTRLRFSVDGPGTPQTTSYPERLAYWVGMALSPTSLIATPGSLYKRWYQSTDSVSVTHTLGADVWGFIKPNLSGTLKIVAGKSTSTGNANILRPSYLEWW